MRRIVAAAPGVSVGARRFGGRSRSVARAGGHAGRTIVSRSHRRTDGRPPSRWLRSSSVTRRMARRKRTDLRRSARPGVHHVRLTVRRSRRRRDRARPVFRQARCKRSCGRERRRTDRQLCGTSLEQRPQSTEQRGEIQPAQRRTTQISRERPPRAEEQSLDGRPAQPELVADLGVREAPPLAQHDRLSLTLRQLGERLAQPEQVGIVGLIGRRRLG